MMKPKRSPTIAGGAKFYPTHGVPPAGAGGGNQVASDHISDQHVQADAMTMIGKPKTSVDSVSSTVKPKGLPPSNAGSPVAPTLKKSTSTTRPLD